MTTVLAKALVLIAITDDLRDGVDGLAARAGLAARGGATMIQVRLKGVEAGTLVDATRRIIASVGVPVVVNDRVDVALAAGAAGVHVGADDIPVDVTRTLVPAGFIVGASLGSEAEAANARLADYAGIGPVFGTATKADAGPAIGTTGFTRLRALTQAPCVAIGGISAANAGEAVAAGAAGIAVVSAVFGARDPERAARELRAAMGR